MITLTAKITLADGTEIPINKKNALSIDENIIDRGDIILPSWGIMSNGGSISFMDFKGDIKKYADNRQLIRELPVEVSLNDTTAGTHKILGSFVTKHWDYDNNSKEVRVQITDELEQWQDIVVDVLLYKSSTNTNASGEAIYAYWRGKTPEKYNMLPFSKLDETTQKRLQSLNNIIFISNSKNLWSAWTQLCVLVQAHIFRNSKGETVFTCRS